MTPFQAIRATFYMLLAKAREPIEERELAPAPTGTPHRPSGTTRPGKPQLKMAQTGRRKTDSPFQHDSILRRSWKAILVWIAQSPTGAKR